MDEYTILGVALIAGIVIWKIFAGIVKFTLIAVLVGGAAYYAYHEGLIG